MARTAFFRTLGTLFLIILGSSSCLQRASINTFSAKSSGIGIGKAFGFQIGSATFSTDVLDIVASDTGEVAAVGYTNASLFEANAFQQDAIVFYLNNSGGLVWSRQLGNSFSGASIGNDQATAVALDSNGDVIVAGFTAGALFQTMSGGTSDIFFMKLRKTDGQILWSTQLGSATCGTSLSGVDKIYSMDIDANGDVFAVGETNSPTSGTCSSTSLGGIDAYIVKISGSSGSFIGFRRAGTASTDRYKKVTVEKSTGAVYVIGETGSVMPGSGEAFGGGTTDFFLEKLPNDISTATWTKQFGASFSASGDQFAGGITMNPSTGTVYFCGSTTATLFEALSGVTDLFVAVVSSAGSLLGTKQYGNVTIGLAANQADSCTGMSFIGSSVMMGGITAGNLGGANLGSNDFFSVRISLADGSPISWAHLGNSGNNTSNVFLSYSHGFSYYGGNTNAAWFASSQAGITDAVVLKSPNP